MNILITLAATMVTVGLLAQGRPERFLMLPTPTQESERAIDAQALFNKHPGQDAIYLERITDIENIATASRIAGYEWNQIHTDYRKILIANPENEAYTTLTIDVPKEHVLHQAALSLWTPDGMIRKFGREDLKEIKDSDGETSYKFAFPGVVKGSVITQAHAIKQLYGFRNAPLGYQIDLQFEAPCEKASFRIVYPDDWTMEVKKIGEDRSLPVIITKDKKLHQTIMSYSTENIPAYRPEPFSPFYKESAIYAEIRFVELNMRASGWRPIHYEAPKGWTELGQRFRRNVIDNDPVFSQRVGNKTQELIRDCDTDYEKLDAIITWLQRNMRPVSYAENRAVGLDDGNFANNLQQLQGTISQITGLAMSMLRRAGIQARYLLIHSAKDGYFDPMFFSHSQLDIPAVLALIEGKTYVVFPYQRRIPVDHVPEEYQGQKAMAIDASGKIEFLEIPLGSNSTNETLESYQLTLSENGQIKVEEERLLTGASAYSTRMELAGRNHAETLLALKRMITFTDGRLDLKSHSITDLYEFKNPLKIQMEYVIGDLLTFSSGEVVFSTGELFRPISRIKTSDSPKDRRNDIRIYFDETIKKNITINLPATWSPVTRLKDFKTENRFGSIQGIYRIDGSTLKGEQILILKKASAPRNNYPELLELAGRKTPHSIPALVFKVKR